MNIFATKIGKQENNADFLCYDVPEATAITLGFEVKVNCEHCGEHFPLKVNFMQIPNEVAARIHLANN